MAIQWADDFSRYGTGSDSRLKMLDGLPYAEVATSGGGGTVVDDPDPNDDGRAFELNRSQTGLRIALTTVVSSGLVGSASRFWLSNLPTSSLDRAPIIQILDGASDPIVRAVVEPNGSIVVEGEISGSLTEVADTVNPVVSPGAWQHIEIKHNVNGGTGALYVDGVEELTWEGVDTFQAEQFRYSVKIGSGTGVVAYIKDLVNWDGSTTQNNDTLGTVFCLRLQPNADTALGGWTVSTGTEGWPLLDGDPDDSTYISAADSDPLPSPAEFGLTDLPPDITSVKGLVSVVRARKIDGGDGNLQTALSSNQTDYDNGADRPITSAFAYWFDVSELDPADASAWTPVDVDSATIRVDRTA